jgi:hypothetical protein
MRIAIAVLFRPYQLSKEGLVILILILVNIGQHGPVLYLPYSDSETREDIEEGRIR